MCESFFTNSLTFPSPFGRGENFHLPHCLFICLPVMLKSPHAVRYFHAPAGSLSPLSPSQYSEARPGKRPHRVALHNIRDYTHDRHHTTDDTPYGGGGGMVMKPEPIFEAVESVLGTPPPAR